MRLKMASSRFVAIKSATASRFLLILPVKGQKVKCIGPGTFEIGVRSREEEPAGTTDRTAITDRLGHDLDISL